MGHILPPLRGLHPLTFFPNPQVEGWDEPQLEITAEKGDRHYSTFKVTVRLRVRLPEEAVRVKAWFSIKPGRGRKSRGPWCAWAMVVTVSKTFTEFCPSSVMELGEKVQSTPGGRPVQLSATLPANARDARTKR